MQLFALNKILHQLEEDLYYLIQMLNIQEEILRNESFGMEEVTRMDTDRLNMKKEIKQIVKEIHSVIVFLRTLKIQYGRVNYHKILEKRCEILMIQASQALKESNRSFSENPEDSLFSGF